MIEKKEWKFSLQNNKNGKKIPSARDHVITGSGYASVSQSIIALRPLTTVTSVGSIRQRGGTDINDEQKKKRERKKKNE